MAGVLKVYNAATSSWEDVINVAASQFTLVENQTPTGSINGTNKDFTLPTGFVASTLKVYKNGVRMKPGGDDYTATSTGFTMTTAPATGTVLLCDYALGDGTNVVGGNSLVSDEVPTGTVNGTNKVFTTARGYVGATLQVFINGVKQRRGADFVETTPSSGTFTMDEAPLTGDVIFVNYSYNLNPSSNADTVDGINANATPTANTLYPLDANAKLTNNVMPDQLLLGWISADETWTYASATTFTVAGDVTAKYSKGTRVKFTQTTVKYGTVASSSYSAPNTTVTLIGNSDYSIANASISGNYYSYSSNPQGFPAYFNFSNTIKVTGGTVPTYATAVYRFQTSGSTITVFYQSVNTTGGTAGASANIIEYQMPVNAMIDGRIGFGSVYNGGTLINGKAIMNFVCVSSSGYFYLAGDSAYNTLGADQNNANRYIYITLNYIF